MDTLSLRAHSAPVNPKPRPRVTVPFAPLPHALLNDPRLNDKAVRVAACLLWYAREKPYCWPSNGAIGVRLGCCARTAQNALRALKAAGWVRLEQTKDYRTNRRIWLAWREPVEPSRARPRGPKKFSPRPEESFPAPPPDFSTEGKDSLRESEEAKNQQQQPEPPEPPVALTAGDRGSPDPALAEKAEALASIVADPSFPSFAAALAEAEGAAYVSAAVDAATELSARERVRNARAFVLKVVRTLKADPAAPQAAPAPSATEQREAAARVKGGSARRERAATLLTEARGRGRLVVWDGAAGKFMDYPRRPGAAPLSRAVREAIREHAAEARAVLMRSPTPPHEIARCKALYNEEQAAGTPG